MRKTSTTAEVFLGVNLSIHGGGGDESASSGISPATTATNASNGTMSSTSTANGSVKEEVR